MIRYVLGVILVTSMMALSMTALGDAVILNADNQVENELDTLEEQGSSLLYNEETVPDTLQEPTREVTLSFPHDSLVSADINEVQFTPSPKLGSTRATYYVDGTKHQQILAVPLVDTAYDSFSLEGAKDLDLQLQLDRDTNDRKVVVVQRKSETIIRPGTFVIRQIKTNGPVQSGDDITFDVTIEYTGDIRDSGEVTIAISSPEFESQLTQSRDVALDPGEQTTKTFTFSTVHGESGGYTSTFKVNHEGERQDKQTRTVEVVPDNTFDIEIIDTGREEVADGTHCTRTPCTGTKQPRALPVRTRLINRDRVETENQQIDFTVDGLAQDETRAVSLDGTRTTHETFYIETTDVHPQDYTATVETGEVSDQETITVLGSHFETSIESWSVDTDDSELDVDVRVDNTGQLEDTQSIEVSVDDPSGSTVATRETDVSLRGKGGPTTETVHIPLQSDLSEGEYTITARSTDESVTETITLEADFDVSITSMSTTSTWKGDRIRITAEIDNTGTLPATQTVTLRVRDQLYQHVTGSPQHTEVTLSPKDTPTTVTFSGMFGTSDDEYNAWISTDDDWDFETVPAEE
jgi:hypothetical protein